MLLCLLNLVSFEEVRSVGEEGRRQGERGRKERAGEENIRPRLQKYVSNFPCCLPILVVKRALKVYVHR